MPENKINLQNSTLQNNFVTGENLKNSIRPSKPVISKNTIPYNEFLLKTPKSNPKSKTSFTNQNENSYYNPAELEGPNMNNEIEDLLPKIHNQVFLPSSVSNNINNKKESLNFENKSNNMRSANDGYSKINTQDASPTKKVKLDISWEEQLKNDAKIDPKKERAMMNQLIDYINNSNKMSNLIDDVFDSLGIPSDEMNSSKFKEFYDLTAVGLNAQPLAPSQINNEFSTIKKENSSCINKIELGQYVTQLYKAIINVLSRGLEGLQPGINPKIF